MDIVILLIIIIIVALIALADGSNKKTVKERYSEALGELVHSAADTVADAAFKLTEPENDKKIRLAKDALAYRHGRIYRIRSWDRSGKTLQEYLKVDDEFKQHLEILGLTPEKWQKLAMQIYHMGVIIQESRSSLDYSKKLTKEQRANIFSENDEYYTKVRNDLTGSLKYFSIPINEWINYGETVLDMHNLFDTPDIKKFGYRTEIMPMRDNFHVL